MKQLQGIVLISVLFCLSFKNISAQHAVVQLRDDSIDYFNVGKSLYLFEDKSNAYNFESIRKEDSIFKPSNSKAPNFGTTNAVIWSCLDILISSKNSWYFELDAPYLDTFLVYYPKNGRYEICSLGRRFPLANQELATPDLIFKISPDNFPKDTVLRFYFRTNGKAVVLPAFIGKTEAVIEQQNFKSILYSIYLGIVLTLIITYLSIFITSGKRENLYYILWVIASSWYFAVTKGFLKLVIPPSLDFLLYHTVEPLAIAGFMLLLFNRSSLHIRQVLPSFTKWFTTLLWTMVFILVLCAMGKDQLALKIFEPLMIFLMLFSLIAGVMVYVRGNKFAMYYIIAYAQTFINVGVYILVFMKLLQFNTYTSNASLIGTLLETILLSLGLGAKIHGAEKEKQKARELLVATLQENEKMIKQQNEILETKVQERTRLLEIEKRKSDDLLRNILPAETVQELKLTGYSKPKLFESVSVMFTDFKDFTKICEQVSPEDLVAEIGYCYSGFDRILGKFGLEKIKTIGDSYMCAGGIPASNDNHAEKIVAAAREIIHFMDVRKKMPMEEGEIRFDIRIGINSGSVVAGVVGVKKFAFDIWGDAVNTASRMEQNSEGGKINISGATYELVKDSFKCIYRGKVEAKNKGMIDMYFVE